MGRLVLRRLGATVPVLLLVTAGVFLLLHLTPGDPIDVMMAESVDATVKETLRRELGLDRDRPARAFEQERAGRRRRGEREDERDGDSGDDPHPCPLYAGRRRWGPGPPEAGSPYRRQWAPPG